MSTYITIQEPEKQIGLLHALSLLEACDTSSRVGREILERQVVDIDESETNLMQPSGGQEIRSTLGTATPSVEHWPRILFHPNDNGRQRTHDGQGEQQATSIRHDNPVMLGSQARGVGSTMQNEGVVVRATLSGTTLAH